MPLVPDSFCATAHALWWQETGAFGGGAPTGGGSFVLMLLQTIFALAFVCGLAYVIFRWVLPRLSVARSSNSMVRIVDRLGLDARKSLYVIEVAGRWLLVASSEAGVQLIAELEATSAEEAEREVARLRPQFGAQASAVRGAFAERLAQLMNKKGNGR
jgi:flagellar protein FliO/FliZ